MRTLSICLQSTLLTLALMITSARAMEPAALPEPDLPAVLTLDEALRRFRSSGLDLLIADAAVAAARADELAASAVANPSFTLSVGAALGYTAPDGCPTCSAVAYGVGASDNGLFGDLVSGRRGLRLRIARAALGATRLSRQDAERTLLFQVKQQYAQVVLAQRLVEFSLEVQEAARRTAELTQIRYKAGAISEATLARVEVDKLSADQSLDSAEQARRVAKVGLAFLLGVRRSVPDFAVGTELSRYVAPGAAAALTPAQLLQIALSQRPDLRAAARQRERAQASLGLARRLNVPDLALGLNYQMQGTGPVAIQPPTLSGALTITPPLFNQHRAERDKAAAELRLTDLQYQRLLAQVVSEVESAYAAFSASQRRVLRSENELLARARRARELINFQYQKGAASLLEYLDAQRTYITNNVDYFTTLETYWTALFQLEQAVGTELRP